MPRADLCRTIAMSAFLSLAIAACNSGKGGTGRASGGASGSGDPHPGTGGAVTGGTVGSAGDIGSGGATGSGGVRPGTGGATSGGTGGTVPVGSGGSGSGRSPAQGGATGKADAAVGGTGGAGGGTPGTGGVTVTGGTVLDAGRPGSCTSDLSTRIRVTEIDLGVAYDYNEVDNNGAALGLTPLAISPIPGGGSRVAFLGKSDNLVHVVTLDASDQVVAGSLIGLPGYDVQDIYADASGGVLLISRDALGSTANNNCGDINNLCGLTTNYPTAASCYDMYMVRFDGASETWATKLTDTTASLPAYGLGATTGGNVIFIWSEYAHNGRIAFDGIELCRLFRGRHHRAQSSLRRFQHARPPA